MAQVKTYHSFIVEVSVSYGNDDIHVRIETRGIAGAEIGVALNMCDHDKFKDRFMSCNCVGMPGVRWIR